MFEFAALKMAIIIRYFNANDFDFYREDLNSGQYEASHISRVMSREVKAREIYVEEVSIYEDKLKEILWTNL